MRVGRRVRCVPTLGRRKNFRSEQICTVFSLAWEYPCWYFQPLSKRWCKPTRAFVLSMGPRGQTVSNGSMRSDGKQDVHHFFLDPPLCFTFGIPS